MFLILINLHVDFSGFCEPVDDTVIKYSKSLKFMLRSIILKFYHSFS